MIATSTLEDAMQRPPHVHCPLCMAREELVLRLGGRAAQLLAECRRLDERLGYENARERDERRRAEPL